MLTSSLPRLAASLAGVALALGVALAPIVASATAHVLVWADELDVSGLAPYAPTRNRANHVLDTLTQAYLTRNADGALEPDLLDVVPSVANGGIAAGGKRITLRLRAGLRWSDGAPLTSDDIAYTIATLTAPTSVVDFPPQLRLIDRVEVPNSQTAVVYVRRFSRAIVSALFSSDALPLLPKHVAAGTDLTKTSAEHLPLGAGPFRYALWRPGERVEVERNPFFYGAPPKLERVVFRMLPNTQSAEIALRTGEIDFWPGAASSSALALKGSAGIGAAVATGIHPQFLTFNTTRPALRDPEVRRALRLALDRATVVAKTYHGGATYDDSPLASSDAEHVVVPPVRFDPQRAAAALESAGWRIGPDGVRAKNGVRLELDVVGVAGVPAVAGIIELVRANWRAVGVEVTARTYRPGVLFSEDPKQGILSGRRFDVALSSVDRVATGDLADLFSCAAARPPGANWSGFCDRRSDELFAAYDGTVDDRAAPRIAQLVQARLADLVPAIVVVKRDDYFLFRDNVTGFTLHPFLPVAGTIAQMDVIR